MRYSIRNLELYNDITCGIQDNNGILAICRATVTKKDLAPEAAACLSFKQDQTETTAIPRGRFLFVQGYLAPHTQAFSEEGKPSKELYEAALQLWLEFVWQEIECADDIVYVRVLIPDEIPDMSDEQKKAAGTIFQLFRRKK